MNYFITFLVMMILVITLLVFDGFTSGSRKGRMLKFTQYYLLITMVFLIVLGFTLSFSSNITITNEEVSITKIDNYEIDDNVMCTDCENHIILETERREFLFFYIEYNSVIVMIEED